MIDYITMILLGIGLFFMLASSIGLLRFPDFYSRMHPPTKSTTFGMMFIIIASIVHLGYAEVGSKAIMVIVFLFLTNPVSAHMISRAAYRLQVPLWDKTHIDDLKGAVTHVQMEEKQGEIAQHSHQAN